MHIQLLNYILASKIRTWILISLTGIVFYILNFIWPVPELTRLGQGNLIPDLMPLGTNTEYIQNLFIQLGTTGRNQYLLFLLTLDLIFPVFYSLFFGLLIWVSVRNIHVADTVKYMAVSLSFIAACFDYIENISTIILLNTFPTIESTIVQIGSMATIFKNIFSFIGFVALICFFVYHSIQKIYIHKK